MSRQIRILQGRLFKIRQEDKEKERVKKLESEISARRPSNVQKIVGVAKRVGSGLNKMSNGKAKKYGMKFRIPSASDIF
jgi:hypothetical protein